MAFDPERPQEQDETLEEESINREIAKSEVEEFRVKKALNEAWERGSDHADFYDMTKVTLKERNPERLQEYLDENQSELSEEAKFYLRISIEACKLDIGTPAEGDEIVTLSESEAREFSEYKRHGLLIGQYDTAFEKFVDSGDPNETEIIKLTTETRDPRVVEEYLDQNKEKLSEAAQEYLQWSIRMKKPEA